MVPPNTEMLPPDCQVNCWAAAVVLHGWSSVGAETVALPLEASMHLPIALCEAMVPVPNAEAVTTMGSRVRGRSFGAVGESLQAARARPTTTAASAADERRMRTGASPGCDRRLDWHGGSRVERRGERGSLGALRTRLSAGVPLSQAPTERAILPNVVLRLGAAGAAWRTVDSRSDLARGVGAVRDEIAWWLTVQSGRARGLSVAAGVCSAAMRADGAAALTFGTGVLLVFGSRVGPVAQVVRAHA